MQRFFLSILFIILTLSATAQDLQRWYIVPHVGINLSNISHSELITQIEEAQTTVLTGKTKIGIVAGTDIEYAFNEQLSALFGVYYAAQGCKYDSYIDPSSYKEMKISNNSHYIDLQLCPKLYVGNGFSFEAGVQMGWLLSSKCRVEENGKEKDSSDDKSLCRKMAVSIPMGIGFEYEHVQLRLRYYVPLTKLYNDKLSSDAKNRQISFTVGYRFAI